MKSPTPKNLGYHMPAEWEAQEAIWLTWPHNQRTWPEAMLAEVQRSYVEIVRALHTAQKIKLIVRDSQTESTVRLAFERDDIALTQIHFVVLAAEDSWIRDYGPTFVVDRERRQLAMVKWIFNA